MICGGAGRRVTGHFRTVGSVRVTVEFVIETFDGGEVEKKKKKWLGFS